MSSPFDPVRFEHQSSCLPCCTAQNNNAGPTPFDCNCALPFYRDFAGLGGTLFDNAAQANSYIANRCPNALIAGFTLEGEDLLGIHATYDGLAISPNFAFGGAIFVPNVGDNDRYMEFIASISIAAGANLRIEYDMSISAAAGNVGPIITIYDCTTNQIADVLNDNGGLSVNGAFEFSVANNVIGGEYYVRCEAFGENMDDAGPANFSANWIITSNNNFGVSQPIAQVNPNANVLRNEVRSRPGFDNLFVNYAELQNYVDDLQRECLVGVAGQELVGVAITEFTVTPGPPVSVVLSTNTWPIVPLRMSLSLNAGDVVQVTITNFGFNANVAVSLLDRTFSNVIANNTAHFVTSPVTTELTAPNLGEYIFHIDQITGGNGGDPGNLQFTVSCANGLQTNPLWPYLLTKTYVCPLPVDCETVP